MVENNYKEFHNLKSSEELKCWTSQGNKAKQSIKNIKPIQKQEAQHIPEKCHFYKVSTIRTGNS